MSVFDHELDDLEVGPQPPAGRRDDVGVILAFPFACLSHEHPLDPVIRQQNGPFKHSRHVYIDI